MRKGIEFSELLAYTEQETERWREFFSHHPAALDLPFDIAGTVRALVEHVFAVELHFANLMLGLEKPPSQPSGSSLQEIFKTSEEAMRRYRQILADDKIDWEELVELRLGGWKASRRKMLAQAFTHSLRHWAQIATFLRQQGFKQEWIHDLLLSDAMQ